VITTSLGMLAGLAAAFFSSVSYLVSRHYGTRQQGGGRRLLLLAHLVMGAICGPIAVGLLPAGSFAQLVQDPAVSIPCLVSTGAYFLGTSIVFRVLTRADASRLSPLLGLKVIALAVIVSILPGQPLDGRQWLAVGLCGTAALVLQRGGSGLPLASLALLFVGCTCFAVADLGIVALIDGLEQALPVSRLACGNVAMTLTYSLGGILVLPLVAGEAWRQPLTSADWRAAAEYSLAWLAAMVALYACIGAVGVIFSTILQSTRGIISIVLGAGLARQGWHELESQVNRTVFARRIAAAVLMTTAIALYVS
jgi:drug/metabolite transporter (DMT)-like permease